MTRPQLLRLIAAPVLAALLAACGGNATPAASTSSPQPGASSATTASTPATSTTAPSKPLKKVSLRLAFLIGGYGVPFVLAKDKGYYAQAGLDVSIGEGKGSIVSAETVGNGVDTFGDLDGAAAAQTISKGNPIAAVAGLVESTPMALYSHQPINKVTDLRGRQIITFSGDADFQVLPAVLATAGMTMKDVKPLFVAPQSEPAIFAKSPNAILLAFSNTNGPDVLQLSPKAYVTPYSKFGINLVSDVIVTSLSEIKDHPDEVRAFVAASLKGWDYVLASAENENEALDDTLRAFPNAKRSLLKQSTDITLKEVHSPATQGKPLGWMAQSDWQETVDVLHKYGAMPTVKPIEDYYTNQFLPQSAS